MGKEEKMRWALDPRSTERQAHLDGIPVTNLKPAATTEVEKLVWEKNTEQYTWLQEEVHLEKELETEQEPVEKDYSVVAQGRFMCTHCRKVYKQLGSLIKYLKKNHNIVAAEFVCDKCHKDLCSKKK